MIPNPSKINQQTSQVEKNASMDRFRRQVAHRSAPRWQHPERVLGFSSLFGRKWSSKGPFSDPWKIENRLKNALSRIDAPWTQQGRLIHPSCLIFEGSKNRRFFDVFLDHLFCLFFCVVYSQISKNVKILKVLKTLRLCMDLGHRHVEKIARGFGKMHRFFDHKIIKNR